MSNAPTPVAPVVVTTSGLDVADMYRVAVTGARVEIAADVWARVEAGRAVVERALAAGSPIYGLNTQIGHLRDERVTTEELLRYQVQMVVGHAGGVGAPLPDEDVRAILLARIAGIARGGSGAHPDALRALAALLNAGVHPIVPEIGSVGASDLMHMAAVALVLIGRGEARFRGERLPGAEALARAGLAPYQMQPKDGLALISANGASIGLGALAVLEAERVAALADSTCALALEVIGANPSPYEAVAAAAKPYPGLIAAAAHLRDLLAGSYLYDPATIRSVQDPLSFRAAPQVHGALRDQVSAARRGVTLELNAMDDNPLVVVEEDRMLSTGNFHPMALALDFEALRIGLAHTGMLAERRLSKILVRRARNTGAYLAADETAGSLQGGLLSYAVAALLADLKHLANPVTLGCPPLDFDVEDHATLAPLAVSLARRAIGHLEHILAIEALLSVYTLSTWPALPRLGAGTSALHETIRRVQAAASLDTSCATLVDAARQALLQWGAPPRDGIPSAGDELAGTRPA